MSRAKKERKGTHETTFCISLVGAFFSTKAFSADISFIGQSCTNTNEIYGLSYTFKFGQTPTSVEYHSKQLIQALIKYCTPSSGLNVIINRIKSKTKSSREKGVYKILSKLNTKRSKCDFKFKDLVAAKRFVDDYPRHINPVYVQKIKDKLKEETTYLQKKVRIVSRSSMSRFNVRLNLLMRSTG